MKCPVCQAANLQISDVRTCKGNAIRRRRQCENGHRFSTIEVAVDFSENLRTNTRKKPGQKQKYPEYKIKAFLTDYFDSGQPLKTVAHRHNIPYGTARLFIRKYQERNALIDWKL